MSMALVKDEDSVINHYAGTFAAGSRRAVVRATGNLTVRSQAAYTMFGGGDADMSFVDTGAFWRRRAGMLKLVHLVRWRVPKSGFVDRRH